jgi:hypothetical protein
LELALAAVAAALAFCAEMIGTGVFGAIDADFGGGLATDTAREGCGGTAIGHFIASFIAV